MPEFMYMVMATFDPMDMDELDGQGKDGWELAAVARHPRKRSWNEGPAYHYYFKKRRDADKRKGEEHG